MLKEKACAYSRKKWYSKKKTILVQVQVCIKKRITPSHKNIKEKIITRSHAYNPEPTSMGSQPFHQHPPLLHNRATFVSAPCFHEWLGTLGASVCVASGCPARWWWHPTRRQFTCQVTKHFVGTSNGGTKTCIRLMYIRFSTSILGTWNSWWSGGQFGFHQISEEYAMSSDGIGQILVSGVGVCSGSVKIRGGFLRIPY